MLLEVFSIGLIVPVIMTILNQDVTTLLPLTEPILIILDHIIKNLLFLHHLL